MWMSDETKIVATSLPLPLLIRNNNLHNTRNRLGKSKKKGQYQRCDSNPERVPLIWLSLVDPPLLECSWLSIVIHFLEKKELLPPISIGRNVSRSRAREARFDVDILLFLNPAKPLATLEIGSRK